ncbi:hypothetical protein ACF0H5_008139 [Mactra antiquata]
MKLFYIFGIIVSILYVTESFLFFSSGDRLNEYNVDKSQVSVSGISSGGAMATQMHVIFSKLFMGVGIIAGTPFACSAGNAALAVTVCMGTPSAILPSALELTASTWATLGNIDPTSNMANDRVYIFNGRADSVVNPGIGHITEAFYEHYVTDNSNIKTVFNINAEHCMPTSNYGSQCDQQSKPTDYLSNCNYSAAYDLLNHIYGGNLKRPTSNTQQNGQLLKFGQDEFFYISTPATSSMDNVGYIYVPSGCVDKSKQCKMHVAFHGCEMGQIFFHYSSTIGDKYVRHGGYNEVGELNDIIILYPQAIKEILYPVNPHGCWDWWGYTTVAFATHLGNQPVALKRMIDRVIGA